VSRAVTHEQIDYVFNQLKITGWPHAAAVTLATAALWNSDPNHSILIWFVVFQLAHIMRIFTLDRFWHKTKADPSRYPAVEVSLIAGMVFSGCTWSVIPLLYLNEPNTETFLFISIAVSGMICTSLPALAAYLPAYLGFIAPIFAVLVWRYYELGMTATALLTLCFLAAVGAISFTIHQIITRSITFDLENRELLEEVIQAKENAEEANQAKSRFMAAASHDLRQPLQALGLLLESMRLRSQQQTAVKPLVAQCIDAHGSLSAMLNALLELSRLESQTLEVHSVALPIKDLVNSIVNEFKPQAETKGLVLDVKGDDYFVRTDPVLFGRVVRNLLSNAIKFTDTGKVTLRINRLENDVILSVIDTGIGIPAQEQQKIYDEYYRVATSATEAGAGLGLSVVKKMCQLLNHSIHLYSNPGLGSTFSIKLPLEKIANQRLKEERISNALDGLTVLVLDNDQTILTAISALLQDWNCRAVVAGNLKTAMMHIQSEAIEPDILIADLRLSDEIDGLEAISRLRQQIGRPVPALLISGDTHPELPVALQHKGFVLLHKPVKPSSLRKYISQLVGGERE